jgi:hypothetical protein
MSPQVHQILFYKYCHTYINIGSDANVCRFRHLPDDGDRMWSPKRYVLNKKQDGG